MVATSERGVTFEMATTGVYAWNAQRVVAEGIGWDLFTLLVAVPALFVGAWLVNRGSYRGALFTLGVLGYLLYQYLEYTVTSAFGPLFLAFVRALQGEHASHHRSRRARRPRSCRGSFLRSLTAPGMGGAQHHHVAPVGANYGWVAIRVAAQLRTFASSFGWTIASTLTVHVIDLGLIIPVPASDRGSHVAPQRHGLRFDDVALGDLHRHDGGDRSCMLLSAPVLEQVEVVAIARLRRRRPSSDQPCSC